MKDDIDSPEQHLAGTTGPVEQARIYIEQARTVQQGDPSLALKYAEQALELAKGTGSTAEEAQSLRLIGISRIMTSDTNGGLEAFLESLDLFKKLQDDSNVGRTLDNIGAVYSILGDHVQALETMHEAIAIAERLGDNKTLSRASNNIGNIYMDIADYSKALEYYLRSLSIYENLDEPFGEAIYTGLGNLHVELGEYEKALEYYSKSLRAAEEKNAFHGQAIVLGNMGSVYSRMNELDLAQSHITKAAEIQQQIGDKAGHARDLINLGEIFFKKNEFDEAQRCFENSLSIEVQDGSYCRCIALMGLGEVSETQQRYDAAAAAYLESLQIATAKNYVNCKYKVYLALAQLYEKTGDFKSALTYHKEYTNLKDTIQGEEKLKNIAEIQARFMLEKTEREKDLLKQQNSELSELLKKVESLNARLLDADMEKNDLLGIIAHDLKNPLSSIQLLARFLKGSCQDQKEIIEIGEDIEENSNRMFELLEDLLKANQIESGNYRMHIEEQDLMEILPAALGRFSLAADQKNLTFKTEINSDIKPVKADRSALFQIMDNIISNAVKYSPLGKTIAVRIAQLPEKTRVIIQDEGPGLTEEDKTRLFQKFARLSAQATAGEHSTGLGLYIAKKLTETMDGQIFCESEPGKGAAFIIDMPSVTEAIRT